MYISQNGAIFTNISAITLLLYSYKYFASFSVVCNLNIGISINYNSEPAQMHDKFCHNITALRRHQTCNIKYIDLDKSEMFFLILL